MPLVGMHFRTSLILFLFSALPYLSHAAPDISPDKRTGCFKSDSVSHFILAHTKNASDFDFAIRTGYTAYYPKALEMALALDGFQSYTLSAYEQCGWQKTRSVNKGGHRGDVY
jgi:hypothetical protein